MALGNGLTNFPGGISSMGIPVIGGGGIPATFGKTWFVDADYGSDGNSGTSTNDAFETIPQAYSVARTNRDDVIALSSWGAHVVTEMLDITKSRIHFISLGGRVNVFGQGARSRITMGVTTEVTDIAVMKNTGVGNTFTGIKFDSSNTLAESLYGIVEAGEYAQYVGCEVYKSTDLDVSLAAEVLNNGDSVDWVSCTFGSSANTIADNMIRPNMLLTATIAGKKCRDNNIVGCTFRCKDAGTEAVRIYGANSTDVERDFNVYNSSFINNTLAAGDPAHAVGFGAAQTEGQVLLAGCNSVKHTVMAEASVGINVTGPVPGFATSGVALLT